jgi:hypothetical protein
MIILFYLLILIKLIVSPLSLKFNNFFIYLPDLFFLLFCIIFFLKETSRKKIFLIYLIFVQILIVIISSWVNDTSLFGSVQNISRTILPFAILILLINEPRISLEYNLDKLGIYLCFTVILLSVYAFFNFEPEINRGLILLPSYFGGVHTSSYILLSSFFILFAIYFKNQNNFKIKLFYLIYIILCFYMFSTGWAVRTIFLTFILFFYLYFFSYKINKDPIKSFIFLFILNLIILIILNTFNLINFQNLDQLSSGRLSMYNEKLILISNFTLKEFFLGKGYGSDLIISQVWWWAEKGSHNDYITLFYENGILFTTIFVILLIKLYKLLSTNIEKNLFIVILFTSLISNGFLVRPIAMYIIIFSFLILKKNLKEINV